ncbi:metallophosphoesterase, partial [Desulfatitalea alkaliphila]
GVRYFEVDAGGALAGLRGKTAVHLTDLHIEEMGAREARVLEVVGDIGPDMIFLTGDYIPWVGDAGPAIDFLARLRAPDGVWAVMGDYDYSDGRQSCLFCHAPGSGAPTQAHGVRFLRNAAERVALGDGEIYVGGVDGDAFQAFDGWREFLEGDADTAAILLSHSPLVFDDLDGERSVLVLAGDTHGGQIPLPGWLWGLLGYEKNARYNAGWFERGKSRMYVSRGLGTSHLRLRLLRRPEVVVIAFR